MAILILVAESLLLVLALSTDAFVASFSYGTGGVRIPLPSVLVIAGVCSGTLAASLVLGSVIGPWLPSGLTAGVCFALLLCIGAVKLFDSSVKALIRRRKLPERRIKFCLFSLCFILDVYADPEKADRDYSRVLSPGEAASLSLALSLDGLAAGFGAGLTSTGWLLPVLLSLAVGICAVEAGCCIGRKVSQKLSFDLSWLSGVLLIVLAFSKLL